MAPKSKKKKYLITASIIGVIIVLAIFISTIFALTNINNEKIMKGVSISGIEVSGLTKEEAKEKIEAVYNTKKEQELVLKYEDYETSLNPTLIEVGYDVEKAVEEAYLVGRKENIFISNYDILFTLIGKKDIEVAMNYNKEITTQNIEDINANLPGVVVESSYVVEGDELIITKGIAGVVVNSEELLTTIENRLKDINAKEDYIEIPVINKEPEEIDIQKIHDEIYKEPQDAYYTEEPFAVYPEVEGIDFDVEAAKAILAEDKEEYIIPLTITQPNVTINDIGEKAFPNQLATYTTRYDVSDVDRSTNLRLACEKINGVVVLAGEIFSYNNTLGPRTAAAGYKNAKIYENGAVVDGLGGGICQISSTLYNTVLLANLEIVERRNHQFVTSYVPAGRDATVVYGATDFKFKNTRTYPVRIIASAQNGIATVSIYGIKEENEYTFKFTTKTVATIPFATQYIEDSSLTVGTEQVKQKGTNGLKVETYITKMLNGKAISTTLLSRDTYNAMTRIVLKGTKQDSSQTTQPSQPTPPTDQTQVPGETGGSTPTDDTGSSTETGGDSGAGGTDPGSSTSTEEQLFVDIPKEILDLLEYDNVRTEQKTDTVNKNVAQTKESLLSFGNDENCQLKDIIRYKGTYQLETLEVEIRHYPNQTHRIGDNQRQTTEIIIEDDSLIVKRLYDGMLMRADTILFGIGNERKYKSTSIDVSEPFDYELEDKIETYRMTYTRNGNRLELAGDKNLSGVISEDFSEIDFEEIGSFGRK